MLTLLLLAACHPGAEVQLDSGSPTGADSTMDLTDVYNRIAALEATTTTLSSQVAAQEATIAALQAEAAATDERLDALEAAVAELAGGGSETGGSSGGAGASLVAISAASGSGGSGGSWEPVTDDLTVSATAGSTILAWCGVTNGTGGSPLYRLMIASVDGGYADDAEVVGDNANATMLYGGEALTAWGFWTVPSTGDYIVQCQGRYANAYDITFAAMVL